MFYKPLKRKPITYLKLFTNLLYTKFKRMRAWYFLVLDDYKFLTAIKK